MSRRVEIDADRLGDLVEVGARIGDEDAVARRDDHVALVLVMLVLDVADDDLDDVLDRDEAVGAAIFVDDERHLGARRLHLRQQVDGRHRGRHEQHAAHAAT